MTAPSDPFDDLVITFKKDSTLEQEERFLTELAYALLAISRHLVAMEDRRLDEDRVEP